MKLAFQPGIELAGGRLEIWQPPRADLWISLGVDFAYGLSGSDFDAAIGLDAEGRQVLEAEGRWGTRFADILTKIIRLYGMHLCFVCGEATATGIPVLQELYGQGAWLYHRQRLDQKGEPTTDFLGHVPGQFDTTIVLMRRALLDDKVTIRSERWHEQLCAFRFLPRRAGVHVDAEADDLDRASLRDADVKMGAPPGEHDDLVRAGALAVAGLGWAPRFEPPPKRYEPGSWGEAMGLNEPEPTPDEW